jgi:hypothetical protein
MPGKDAMQHAFLPWHLKGNADGKIARDSAMAAPERWTACLVQVEGEMVKTSAFLGDNEEG